MSDHVVQPATYYKVFITLIVLLILTVAASYVDAGRLNLPIALLIAFSKAAVIVIFFMQLKYASPLQKTFALSGLVFVLILFVITFADYVARGSWDANLEAQFVPGENAAPAEASPPAAKND